MIQATLRKAGDKTAANAAAALNTPTTPEQTNAAVADVAKAVGDADLAAALGVGPTAAPDAPQTNAVVKTTPPGAVSRFAAASDGGFGGEWGKEHLKFPQLKIVQGSGPLSNLFKTGQVILGDEVLLNDPDPNAKPPYQPTMRFIPISLVLRWRENISKEQYAAGQFPRVVDTQAEVEALNGTTRWIGRGPTAVRPSWAESVTCLLLLEKPEGSTHPNFAIDLNGKLYAPCVYYATGTGFTYFAKPIFNANLSLQIVVGQDEAGRPLKKVYVPKRVWTWETKKVKAGDNYVFAPNVKMCVDESTAEVRAFLKEVTGDLDETRIAQED